MNIDFLTRLYWACTDIEMAGQSDLNLGELYQRTPDADSAEHCFNERLYAAELSTEDKNKLGCLSGSVAMAYEKQGFINGFRLGMKLARELCEDEPLAD